MPNWCQEWLQFITKLYFYIEKFNYIYWQTEMPRYLYSLSIFINILSRDKSVNTIQIIVFFIFQSKWYAHLQEWDGTDLWPDIQKTKRSQQLVCPPFWFSKQNKVTLTFLFLLSLPPSFPLHSPSLLLFFLAHTHTLHYLCTHQQFWAVKRFNCHLSDSLIIKSFTRMAWGHDNDRETSVRWMWCKKN